MAAQEYYTGTQGAQELPSHDNPNLYSQPSQLPQPQHQQPQPYPRQHFNAPTYAETPPPSYSLYPQQPIQQQQMQVYHPPQQQRPAKGPQTTTAPYPQTSPAMPYFPPPPQQQNGYLGAPVQHVRSHSQPARVHFADQESDRSTDVGSISDSDESPRPQQRHRRHHSHSHDADYSDRERDRGHRHTKTDKKDRKIRDTFLGAGAGTIIGDVIFPGLGTAAGLLLGGYSGRKYAERSKSEDPPHHHRHRDAYRDGKEEGRRDRRRRRDDYDDSEGEYKRSSKAHRRRGGGEGWDERSATFKKGTAVR
ncbi:uncharacterized protein K460DRAFT_354644 [Cucurbitaria berberidis CBS 394.84]|uniref:PRP38-assoc multi-domain protein n=1 Tax=Cucurbitaria berberidis CBS 394.84 TaxID=1168544 RepID=A0A9P4GEW6_9PLEO|nr:uncharacterized protein K460DRAFT_354644 [Cucurbitaria berberidis CBS 394.84]KAF1844758.1 hypothetical protein K460DRAFT_354644 [Cucurbitaria berberidis CBS 394.84]